MEFSEACRAIRDRDQTVIERAGALRDELFGKTLTYSPKVFLPVTNLCRDRCSYCTFRKGPKDAGAHTMTLDEIVECVKLGRQQGCHEALLCLGDRPEAIFPSYRALLADFGYQTTAEYLVRVSEACLEHGLLPHTNAGLLTGDEMAALRRTNVSLGLMLENVSPRLCQPGGAHQSAPTKQPEKRLAMIEEAGRLRIPFTTGLLVGIGETIEERVETIFAIRDLHQRFGHIQEVIVQVFRAKDGTRMESFPEVGDEELFCTIAVARLLLGEMNLQAPPNLSPEGHRGLIRSGINDWGGISPTTQDFINPEAPWPHLDSLAETCRQEGFTLRPRLPIYPGFIDFDTWIDPNLRSTVERHQGELTYAPSLG